MNALAIDGGTPVRAEPWPSWPPPADAAQRRLLDEVVSSGHWGASSGPWCDRLAHSFAQRHETAHGVAVANATLALFAALRSAGVGPGDEVIVPGYTFVACATAVLLLGATPVVADVHADHLHLSAETVAEAIGPRTRAVMVVHLAGSPAPMDEIGSLAASRGVAVIEDCAQAHGARYHDRPVGGLGTAGVFSFQSSKAMTAGEGGLIVTDDAAFAERAWSAVNVGRTRSGAWYEHADVGWNLRMTELQAALLVPWLDRLDAEIARRKAFTEALRRVLAEADVPVEVVPDPDGTTVNSRHLVMLRVRDRGFDGGLDRAWVLEAMAAEGVPLDGGYPPLATTPALAGRVRTLPTPSTDEAARSVFWIRQPQLMADPDAADDVVAALRAVLSDPRSRVRT